MNETIQSEIMLLLNIYEVKGNEQVKILAICSKILDSKEYMNKLKDSLNGVFTNSDFNFIIEFSRLINAIICFNGNLDFYKNVSQERMKYIIYCILFAYMLKYQPQTLNSIPSGELRLLYSNSIDLVLLLPETIKINKESCSSCLGRNFSLFKWLAGGRIYI